MKIHLKTIVIISCLFFLPTITLAVNSTGYAWSENAGWTNTNSTNGGITVSATGLTGYLWLENAGWIKLDYDGVAGATNTTSTNWGVVNDGSGNLSGYAWGENIGWIDFHPTDSQVTIDSSGIFSGYAWSENIGWIKFDHTQISDKPTTTWRRDTVATTSTASSVVTNKPVSKAIKLEGTVTGPKNKVPTITLSKNGSLRISTKIIDPDQLKKVTIRIGNETIILNSNPKNKVFFSTVLNQFKNKVGKYGYILTADYGTTQVREKGIINIVAQKDLPVALKDVNNNFRAVYGKNPTFKEWQKWTSEVLKGITKTELQKKMRAGR